MPANYSACIWFLIDFRAEAASLEQDRRLVVQTNYRAVEAQQRTAARIGCAAHALHHMPPVMPPPSSRCHGARLQLTRDRRFQIIYVRCLDHVLLRQHASEDVQALLQPG